MGGHLAFFSRTSLALQQTKGTEIAKEFQRLTLDMDKPAKEKDYEGFLAAHKKGVQAFQDFVGVLSDVPDEI